MLIHDDNQSTLSQAAFTLLDPAPQRNARQRTAPRGDV